MRPLWRLPATSRPVLHCALVPARAKVPALSRHVPPVPYHRTVPPALHPVPQVVRARNEFFKGKPAKWRMAEPCLLIIIFVTLGMILPLFFPCTPTQARCRRGRTPRRRPHSLPPPACCPLCLHAGAAGPGWEGGRVAPAGSVLTGHHVCACWFAVCDHPGRDQAALP